MSRRERLGGCRGGDGGFAFGFGRFGGGDAWVSVLVYDLDAATGARE